MSDQQVQKWLKKVRHFLRLDKISPLPRKIIVLVVGGALLVAGVIMIVTPGPAFILIPAGILFLASEFKWAEKWAQKMMNGIRRIRDKWRKKRAAQ